MWVARFDSFKTNLNLFPTFGSAIECQEYIDKNLKVLEYLCKQLDNFLIYNSDGLNLSYVLNPKRNNYIRCYNLKEKRFADGFDF